MFMIPMMVRIIRTHQLTQYNINEIINALDDIINIYMNNKIEHVENAVNYEYVEESLCGYERRS